MNVRVSQVGKLDAGGACSAGAQRAGCCAQQAVEVVKGKGPGSSVVTLSRTQILTGLNKPDAWFLVVVETDGERALRAHYIPAPFQREPDFAATSVNYDLGELLARARWTVEL